MLGGSAFSQLGALIDNPASLPSLIGTALPTSSNFFINYMIIQARPRRPPRALRCSALTRTACLTHAAPPTRPARSLAGSCPSARKFVMAGSSSLMRGVTPHMSVQSDASS
jgi:hypothetical protein